MKKTNLLCVFMLVCLFSVQPSWGQIDVITADKFPTSYSDFTIQNLGSGISYVCNGCKTAGQDGVFQLSNDSKTRKSGIVTTSSQRQIKSIKVEWMEKGVDETKAIYVYGSHTPYKSVADLWGTKPGEKICTIHEGKTSVFEIADAKKYKYIGVRAVGATAYMKSLTVTWSKKKLGLAFEKSICDVLENKNFTEPKLLNVPSGLEVTYSSSDKDVALVDAKTGEVNICATGTTEISAVSAPTGEYDSDTASYTLVVIPEGLTYKASFDFTKPGTLSTPYVVGENFKYDNFLYSDDAVLQVTKGNQECTFNKEKGMAFGKSCDIDVVVPMGMKICDAKMALANGSDIPVKTLGFDRVNYHMYSTYVGWLKTVEITYAGTYKFKVGSTGYATFSGALPYVMPEGLQGGIVSVSVDGTKATVDYCVKPGDVVGAQQALLLKGTPGEYTLRPSSEGNPKTFTETENLLRPMLTNNEKQAPEGKQYFIFAKKDNGLGFYWQSGSSNGNKIRGLANKAFLEVPASLNVTGKGFSLDLGGATGIVGLHEEGADDEVYSVSGVRINCPKKDLPKGIYIVKGKKFLVK